MPRNDIDEYLKDTFEGNQFTFQESHWHAAKAHMAAQKRLKLIHNAKMVGLSVAAISIGALAWMGLTNQPDSNEIKSSPALAQVIPLQSADVESDKRITQHNGISDVENVLQLEDPEVNPTGTARAIKNTSERRILTTSATAQESYPSNKILREEFTALGLTKSNGVKSGLNVDLPASLLPLTTRFKSQNLKPLDISLYGEYAFAESIDQPTLQISGQERKAVGVMANFELPHHFSLGVGLGYAQTSGNWTKSTYTAVPSTVQIISDASYWDVQSNTQTTYDIHFENGIPIYADSTQVTTLDSTYITAYDTAETQVLDSMDMRITNRVVLTSIDIPIYLSYRKTFGRVGVYGSGGLNLSYTTSVALIGSTESNWRKEDLEINDFQADLNLSAGVSYHINPNWSIEAGPVFRSQLRATDQQANQTVNAFGARASISYRLR